MMANSACCNACLQSGFFYAPIPGCTDRCIYYASGNALFNWDPNDDPWTEYKKWYPNCPYVKKKEAAANNVSCGFGCVFLTPSLHLLL